MMNLSFQLQILHHFSVYFMTGVIWIIQCVHYPLMKFVDPGQWREFHQKHSQQITFIVGPLMLLQLGSAFLMNEKMEICVGLSVLVFLFTGLISVPLHNKLAQGYEERTLKSLVSTNWLRTLTWTLHSFLLLSWLSG